MSTFEISMSPRLLCRICHQRSPDKELIEPCNCQGSIGRVHRTCIEKWLTISKRNKCELCGLSFACRLEAPQLMQYLRGFPRPLMADLLLFSFLTPIAALITLLCYQGAMEQVKFQNLAESSFLLSFGLILLLIYFAWVYYAIRNNYRLYQDWRQGNPNLKLIYPNQRQINVIAKSEKDYSEDEVFIDLNSNESQSSNSLIENEIRAARLRSSNSA